MKFLGTLILLATLSIASAQISENVQLVSNWDSPQADTNEFGSKYNDVWGFEKNGTEYAVIGGIFGSYIINLGDPFNPTEVEFFPGDQSIWRDFKVYRDHLYIVADGSEFSTLQIVDISDLPESVELVYDSNELFARAHNVFIDTNSARMYLGIPDLGMQYDMSVYSLADPVAPTFLNGFRFPRNTHDMYVRNDTAYLSNLENGLLIADLRNIDQPVYLDSLKGYTENVFNHSGWLNERGDVFVSADEVRGEELKVIDVADKENISLITDIPLPSVDSLSIAHNVMFNGDICYASHYNDGLQIYDLSEPANPVRIGYYDTYPQGFDRISGAWGIYSKLPSGLILISDMRTGLYVLDASDALVAVNESIDLAEINIYPNPGHDLINIELGKYKGQLDDIHLTNLTGKRIDLDYTLSANQAVIDVSTLEPSIYQLQLRFGETILVKKLVKK